MSSHFRQVTRIFGPSKRIDLCYKISIILVPITRPNSTKNITCSNIYDCLKQTMLRYCPIRQLTISWASLE